MRLIKNSGDTYTVMWEFFNEKPRWDLLPKRIPNDPSGWKLLDILQKDCRRFYRTDLNWDRLNDIAAWDQLLVEIQETYPEYRDYQVSCVASMVYLRHFCIFVDMGLGKTAIAVAGMLELQKRKIGNRFLVVCPKTLIINWELEIKKWDKQKKLNVVVVDDTSVAKRANKIASLSFFTDIVAIINYESFSTQKSIVEDLKKAEIIWDAVILDESSRLRNDTNFKAGLFALRKYFRRRYLLSGYPAPYSPSDYVYQLAFLSPAYLGYESKKKFCEDFAKKDHFGNYKWNSHTPALEWLYERVRDVGLVLHKSDAGVKLPEKMYIKHTVYLTNEQQKHYNQILEEYRALVEKFEAAKAPDDNFNKMMNQLMSVSEAEDFIAKMISKEFQPESRKVDEGTVLAEHTLVVITRLSQITGGFVGGLRDPETSELKQDSIHEYSKNPKLDALMELWEQAPPPLVVFAHYTWEIKAIVAEFKKHNVKVGGIYGTTDTASVYKQWLDEKLDVLVVNPQKGGMGLNLQRASRCVFYSNSYRPEDRVQAENRLHRLGSDAECVLIYDLVADNTIDEDILNVHRSRQSLAMAILSKNSTIFRKKV